MSAYKDAVCGIFGIVGGAIAYAFGGWDSAMTTLITFMAIDYITGLILGWLGLSDKSETGRLNSHVGWVGLIKKALTLLVVFMAYRFDKMIGTTYIKDAAIIAFVVNEAISIIENAGKLGVPIPESITKAIEVLKNKESS